MPSSALPPEATQHSRPQTQPRVLALTWDAKRSPRPIEGGRARDQQPQRLPSHTAA